MSATPRVTLITLCCCCRCCLPTDVQPHESVGGGAGVIGQGHRPPEQVTHPRDRAWHVQVALCTGMEDGHCSKLMQTACRLRQGTGLTNVCF